MKLRHSVPFLALALLFSAFAAGAMPIEKAAAAAPAAAPLAQTADSAASTPAEACSSKVSEADAKLQIALSPNLAWLSSKSQGLTGTCGSCGDSACNGMAVGAVCGFDGVNWYACVNLYGNFCGGPARQQCYCTTGGPL